MLHGRLTVGRLLVAAAQLSGSETHIGIRPAAGIGCKVHVQGMCFARAQVIVVNIAWDIAGIQNSKITTLGRSAVDSDGKCHAKMHRDEESLIELHDIGAQKIFD